MPGHDGTGPRSAAAHWDRRRSRCGKPANRMTSAEDPYEHEGTGWCLRTRDQPTARAIEDSAAPIFDSENQVIGVVLVFHDVTQERRMARQISWQATHDSLTGLSNRGEFDNQLSRLIDDSQDRNTQHALLYLDLDQFKVINDTCGHAAGDRVLVQVRHLLEKACRDSDTLIRWGGDEFLVVARDTSLSRAETIAERIRVLGRNGGYICGPDHGIMPDVPMENVLAMYDEARNFKF